MRHVDGRLGLVDVGRGMGSYMRDDWGQYNVRSYGAIGDGVTDDTSAVQAAIDAAYAVGGASVYIPDGLYLVTGLDLKNGVVLQGVGRTGSVIVGSGDGEIVSGAVQSATSSTLVLDSSASGTNEAYKGLQVYIESGTGAGQYRWIKTYTGSTRTVTVSRDWDVLPDATSVYSIRRALIQSDNVNSRRYYIELWGLAIQGSNFLCVINWSDISSGVISNCRIDNGKIGINLRHQAYFNYIVANRIDCDDCGIMLSAGVDTHDEPNTNSFIDNNINYATIGVEIEAGYGGIHNRFYGGYLQAVNIGMYLGRYAQKVTNTSFEGVSTSMVSTGTSTVYTSTTVTESGLSLSSVQAGWVARAATGEFGIIVGVDDTTDTVTVRSWYPSQPVDGTSCVFVRSVGILLGSMQNSIIGVHFGGGYASGTYYILNPGRRNLVLHQYAPASTNAISVAEKGMRPLELSRVYTTTSGSSSVLLGLYNEGTSVTGTETPIMLDVNIATDSAHIGSTAKYIRCHNDGVEKFIVQRDGDVTAYSNISVATAGAGIKIKEGTNARMGTSTLVEGTVTVANTSVTANTRIFLTNVSPGGTVGALYVSSRVAGESFTITSTSATDTSTVAWLLVEPAS